MLRLPQQIGRVVGKNAAKLGLAIALAAPFVTHLALATGRYWHLAAGFTAIQVIVIGSMALRPARGTQRRWTLAALTLAAAALLARVAGPGFVAEPTLVAMSALSHAALYLSLLALFGSSLQRGHTPLVTGLARRLRGPLPPATLAYTRGVTWAWCGYFVGQLAVSAGLLLWAPVAVWSLFVNVLDAPLLVTMFAAEFAVRLWRLPEDRHVSPLTIFRSFSRGATQADAG